MCGIAGILRFGEDREHPPVEAVYPALAAMGHRGPDRRSALPGRGAVIGSVRLNVVDLEGGTQPMKSPFSVLAYNGEIHDYVEHRERLVREDGITPATQSDTEVLLRLLDRDGTAALPTLSGMFAFARLEHQRGVLTLARDAFGVKPLLYEVDRAAGELRFASELGGLLALRPPGRPRLDLAALAERMSFQVPFSDRTLVAGVRSLPPGTFLVADRTGRVEITRWHEVVFAPDEGPTEREWEEALRAELARAGEIALRADVPLGVTLSGGLDSSLTAGLAARAAAAPPVAYTGFFDGGPAFDERAHARRAASELGLALVEVPVGARDLRDRLPELAVRLEGPIAGPGSLPQLAVAERAAADVRVLIGGQGADEIFGGYARHRIAWLAEAGRLGDGPPPDLAAYAPLVAHLLAGEGATLDDRFFRLVHRGEGLGPLLGPAARAAMEGYDARAAFADAFREEDGDPFHRMVSFERRTLLPALLHVEDRVTMARSVESRVPLLDLRIVDLAARIPPRISFGEGEPKRILRRAAAGLAPPSAVARRDKMGFPVPLPALLATPEGAEVLARLRDGPLVREGILAPGAAETLAAGAGGHGRHLWFFLLLSAWMEAVAAAP